MVAIRVSNRAKHIERSLASYLLSQRIKVVFARGEPFVAISGCDLLTQREEMAGKAISGAQTAILDPKAKPVLISLSAFADFLNQEVPDGAR